MGGLSRLFMVRTRCNSDANPNGVSFELMRSHQKYVPSVCFLCISLVYSIALHFLIAL